MKNYISLFIGLFVFVSFSQEKYLGDGPYEQLIIRGVTLINGDGSPPKGPVDIVVEKNIITDVKSIGYPGAIKLNEKNEVIRTGGVKYTVKDGIIYDAKRLLKEVKEMVDEKKREENWELKQPGIK